MFRTLYPCGVCNDNEVILNRLVGANRFSIGKPDFKKITTQVIEKTGHA